MTRTIDFDAYRAERRAEPVVIKIGGEEYNLASEMPAEVALEVVALRQQYGDKAVVPAERIGELARALFGAELLDTLMDKHRLTTPELAALVIQVFGQYQADMAPNPTARKKRATSKSRSRKVSSR